MHFILDQWSSTFKKDWAVASKMKMDWKIKNFLKNLGKKDKAVPKRDRKGYQGKKPESCRLVETSEGLDYTIVWSDGREQTVRLKTFGDKSWEK